ncbi:hypothetical protein LEP1GSC061_0067, partial [Leptospira wolffii serovar Khorat str. Khorat-H2]
MEKSEDGKKNKSAVNTSSKFKHAGIRIEFFEQITKKILQDFYKKKCPHCENQILD